MKENEEPWNIELALETAKGFQEAGKLIYNKVQQEPNSLGLGIASGVNYGIAIELHLKILYYFDMGYIAPSTHNLTYIYKKLSLSLKSDLQLDFEKIVKSFDKETLKTISNKEDILEGYFSYAEKICVTWRYYGLDTKSPPKSGFTHVNEVLSMIDNHITRLRKLQE